MFLFYSFIPPFLHGAQVAYICQWVAPTAATLKLTAALCDRLLGLKVVTVPR